jgi:hypothetical protein
MKAQELPLSTIVVVALGFLFFVVLMFIFLNIGSLGDFFAGINPSTNAANCEVWCNQANNFVYDEARLAEIFSAMPFCINGCQTPCTVFDSNGVIRDLVALCSQYG